MPPSLDEVWTGDRSLLRYDEKIEKIIRWLYQFDFSTRQILSTLLNVDNAGQYGFYKKLIDKNLIEEFRSACLRQKLIKLGEYGRYKAAVQDGLPEIKPLYRVAGSTIIHDLTVQLETIKRMRSGDIVISAQRMKEEDQSNRKQPDSVVYANERVAIEVELTKKSDPHIYTGLVGNVKRIKSNDYDKVIYIFNDSNLLNHYKNKCYQSSWPTYKKDARGRMIKEKSVDVSKINIDNLICFEMGELYK